MKQSVYLVLDMQNDLVHPDGPAAKGPMAELLKQRRVIENTQLMLQRVRAADIAVSPSIA